MTDDKSKKIYQYLLIRAESLLLRRPKTESQIRLYLQQKIKRFKIEGTVIINQVIDELKQLDLINDPKFIKLWIEDRSYFKPRGARLLTAELIKKGINRQLVIDYLDNNPVDNQQLAKSILEKKFRKQTQPDPKKMLSLLLRRGFDFEVSKKAIEDFVNKE